MPPIWIKLKFWIYRHCILVSLATLILCVALALTFARGAQWEIKLTLLGAPFTVFYFLQKQTLEELEMFKRLFTEFNDRYQSLSDQLNRIVKDDSATDLSDADTQLLYNYFNLCGEEYLFCQQGYIYPEVWKAWRNGMRFFLQSKRIRGLWKQELERNDSYYGLTFNEAEMNDERLTRLLYAQTQKSDKGPDLGSCNRDAA